MQTRKPKPAPRSQTERRAETRRALLDAALEVMREVGYARVTFGAIAKHAGLTTGALQHHFDTKADLIHAVLVERLMPVMEKGGLESQAGRPLRARCKTIVDLYWGSYRDPAYPVVWDIILGAREDPELAARIRRFQREGSERSLHDVEAAFDGLPLGAAQIRRVYLFITAQLRGLALLRPFESDESVFRGQRRLLVDMLCEYVEAMLAARNQTA